MLIFAQVLYCFRIAIFYLVHVNKYRMDFELYGFDLSC